MSEYKKRAAKVLQTKVSTIDELTTKLNHMNNSPNSDEEQTVSIAELIQVRATISQIYGIWSLHSKQVRQERDALKEQIHEMEVKLEELAEELEVN